MRKSRTFQRGAATIIAVDDPLMEDSAADLLQNVEDLLSAGNLHLVADLGSVPYIDSSGLEALLDLSTKAREAGGTFCLASPNDLCRDVLKATRLDNSVLVYPTVDEACRSFL